MPAIVDRKINEDIEVFSGSENNMTFSHVYRITFFCDYPMQWYPFDQQTYVFDWVLYNYADILPGNLNFTCKHVKDYKIHETLIHQKGAVVIKVMLGRRLLEIFLSIYFPTILLLMLADFFIQGC